MESPRSTTSSVESRSKILPSIANLSREELERMACTLVRRQKQRDKETKGASSNVPQSDRNTEAETASISHENSILKEKCERLTEELAVVQTNATRAEKERVTLCLRLSENQSGAAKESASPGGNLTEMHDENQALQLQVETLKEATRVTVEERDASFSRLAEERDRRVEIESALSNAQTQLRKMHDDAEAFRKSNANLLDMQWRLDAIQQNTEQEIAAAGKRHQEEKQTFEQMASSILEKQRQIDEESEAWRRQAVNQSKVITELQTDLQQIQKTEEEKRELMERLEEKEKELQLQKEMVDTAESAAELEKTVQELKEDLNGAEETIQSLKQQREEEQKKSAGMESSLREFDELCADLKRQVDEEKSESEKLRNALASLKTAADSHGDETKAEIEKLAITCARQQEKIESVERLSGENDALTAHLSALQTRLTEQKQKVEADLDLQQRELETVHSQLKDMTERRRVADEEQQRLQTELKVSEKARMNAVDSAAEMEAELTRLKEGLSRTASNLEEEMQSHRICIQRLNDEQETGQHLKKQLQEAFAKMQTSDVDKWKQQEAMTAKQAQISQQNAQREDELRCEIDRLRTTIAGREQLIANHGQEVERVKENAHSEREKLKRAIAELKKRFDRVSAQLKKNELEGTELQTSHFSEKGRLEGDIVHYQQQSEKLAADLKDYRAKAHLLLRSKEAELNSIKAELQQQTDLSVDLKVLTEKFDDLTAERNQLSEELNQANERFQIHLDGIVADFQQQIDEKSQTALSAQAQSVNVLESMEQLRTSTTRLKQEVDAKQKELECLIASKEAEKRNAVEEDEQKYLALRQELSDVKEEFSVYKQSTEQITEAQQLEMSRLIQSNLELRRHPTEDMSGILSPSHLSTDHQSTTREFAAKPDSFRLSDLLQTREVESSVRLDEVESLGESQIVALANKQAEREGTFQSLKRQNDRMLLEIEELEKELELHRKQEAMLKEYLREADQLKLQLKAQPPAKMDYQYLKNTVMKLLTTGESEALLPVFATLLNFTDEERSAVMESIQTAKAGNADRLDAGETRGLLSSWTGVSWI